MAIDDNTSYELTGYQVKDLAQKIRAKADLNSLASVATSGLYSDLTGAPTIPTVYNGTLTIQQNGTTVGTFSANQSTDETINITGGGALPQAILYVQSVPYTINTVMPIYKDANFTEQLTLAEMFAILKDENIGAVTLARPDGRSFVITEWDDDQSDLSYLTFGYVQADGVHEFGWHSQDSAPTFLSVSTQYTIGNGISLDANNREISIDDTVVATQTDLADKSDKFVIMKYGESNAWAKFIAAYNSNAIVYCRASSNANPASGSQTRMAFMAYVSNETNPTNVEFQYVRSVGSKTSSQPVDQVFVYKLENTNGGTWSVQTRDMAPKIAAGTGINVSYNNGTYTISLA